MIVSVSTPDICVEDLPNLSDAGMKHLAEFITKGVQFLHNSGAEHINVFWRRIPKDQPCSIDGTVGFFQIQGRVTL